MGVQVAAGYDWAKCDVVARRYHPKRIASCRVLRAFLIYLLYHNGWGEVPPGVYGRYEARCFLLNFVLAWLPACISPVGLRKEFRTKIIFAACFYRFNMIAHILNIFQEKYAKVCLYSIENPIKTTRTGTQPPTSVYSHCTPVVKLMYHRSVWAE